MRYVRILIAMVLLALGIAVVPDHASAGVVNMGGGITCHGSAPVYGANPRIACSRTSSRYATRTDWYRDPYNPSYCDVYQMYGSAWVWAGGSITWSWNSSTYAGYWRC